MRRLSQQPQPQILRDVGVLIFVDQNIAKAALVVGEHIRVVAEQPQLLEQKIAEVAGIQRLEPLLIGGVELLALAVGERHPFADRNLVGRQSPVLPAVEDPGEHACRPSFFVDIRDSPAAV